MVKKITDRRRLASVKTVFTLIELLAVKSSIAKQNLGFSVPFCHSADI
jgi:hypothetical protein